jgi:Flp pilus assembly protein TadG
MIGVAALRECMRCERGAVTVLAALLIPVALLALFVALDVQQTAQIAESLRGAAASGARQIAGGVPQDDVIARLKADLAAADPDGAAWGELTAVLVQDDDSDRLTLSMPLHGPAVFFSHLDGAPSRVTAEATVPSLCAAGAARWTPQTHACPDGQAGMISYEQEERSYCPSPAAAPAWRATGRQQAVVSTCADVP